MKKSLLSIIAIVGAVSAMAVSKVYIVKTDGTEIELLLSEIDSIRIEMDTTSLVQDEVVDADSSIFYFDISTMNGNFLVYGLKDKHTKGAISIPSKVRYHGEIYEVTEIRSECFYDCYNLTDIKIPNSVTTIGGGAFMGCRMTSIEIPSSVTEIEESAFDGCKRLASINVDKSNKVYSSLDGVLFNKNQSEIIDYPEGKDGKYIIPNSVIKIGEGAFDGCSNLTDMVIPSTITKIGVSAFDGCSSLTSINPNRLLEYSNLW